MAIRTRLEVKAALSSTPNEEKDLGNQASSIVNDVQGEGGTFSTKLAAAAVDVPMQLTGLAVCRAIFVRTFATDPTTTPGDVILRKNNIAGEAITIRPLSGAKEGLMMLTTDSIVSLYLSNPGTVGMTVVVAAAGD